MSTICKIALAAVEQDVLVALRSFLQERGLEFVESTSEWPLATKHDAFLPGQTFPSLFSVKQVSGVVTEIHFNSFSSVAELASFLSQHLATPVVVNEYQSVSTASYWALHSAGALVRSIEAGDGEVSAQQGAPLPLKGRSPATTSAMMIVRRRCTSSTTTIRLATTRKSGFRWRSTKTLARSGKTCNSLMARAGHPVQPRHKSRDGGSGKRRTVP
jgi:hypothetical protein